MDNRFLILSIYLVIATLSLNDGLGVSGAVSNINRYNNTPDNFEETQVASLDSNESDENNNSSDTTHEEINQDLASILYSNNIRKQRHSIFEAITTESKDSKSNENSTESVEDESKSTKTVKRLQDALDEKCSSSQLEPNPELLPPQFVCTFWTGRENNGPFGDQCDCNWNEFHKCLCKDSLGWSVCLNLCTVKA